MVNSFILLIFAFFLREYLSPFSLTLVVLGMLISLLRIKFSQSVRTVLTIFVFIFFFFTVRKVSDPEGWLNFLTAFLVLKIFEKETIRDNYIQFFGLILLLSVGSLFERDIPYVIFFTLSLGVLLQRFYSFLGYKSNFRKVGGTALAILPFIIILFFVIPRSMSPIPLGTSSSREGKVGYTPEVNLSNLESLSGDQTPVFQAMVSKRLERHDLYWRGNILTMTDGWNWPLGEKHYSREIKKEATPLSNEIRQVIRLHSYQESFFGLDYPRSVSFSGQSIILGENKSLQQPRSSWRNSYSVISDPRVYISSKNDLKREYLQTSLSKKSKEVIEDLFKSSTFSEITKDVQNYFQQQNFQYSLSPGRILSLEEFLLEKKIGLCSHYSSALALVLRTKGIPARLVSGFLGGEFNEFGDYYLITQNDAHVWVEALHEGRWIRIDPTEWIAPERVNLSGSDFVSERTGEGGLQRLFSRGNQLRRLAQWFEQWNFAFYQWLDEVDYFSQIAFLEKFKLKRSALFILSGALILLFVFISVKVFGRSLKKKKELIPSLWEIFFEKLAGRGIKVTKNSLLGLQREISDPELEGVLKDLVEVTYRNKTLPRKLIKKINNL